MKQKQINTGVCTLLFVEVPENSDVVRSPPVIAVEIQKDDFDPLREYKAPPGNWRLLCKVSEVREELSKKIVAKEYGSENRIFVFFGYRNYETKDKRGHFLSPMRSFNSLLRANGILFENPYESTKKGMTFSNEHKNEWELAQEKVWDKDRTYIFKLKEQ